MLNYFSSVLVFLALCGLSLTAIYLMWYALLDYLKARLARMDYRAYVQSILDAENERFHSL